MLCKGGHVKRYLLFGGECRHDKVMPEFDREAALALSSDEVRERWPRFEGTCPDCGWRGALYASRSHYLLGDY